MSKARFGHLTLPCVFFCLGQDSNWSWSLFFLHTQAIIASWCRDRTSQRRSILPQETTQKQHFFKGETSLVLVLWMRFYLWQKGPKWSNPRFGHLTLPHVFFRLGQVSNCSWSLFFQHHQPLIASCFGDGTSQTLAILTFQTTKKQLFSTWFLTNKTHQQVFFFRSRCWVPNKTITFCLCFSHPWT